MTSSFVQEMWPILSALRIWGWLPVHRYDKDKLELRARNVLYTTVVLPLFLLTALYIVVMGFKLVATMPSSRQLISYLQLLCGVLLPQLMTLVVTLQSPQHIKFINKMQRFQEQFKRISISQNAIKWDLRGLSTFILVMHTTPPLCIMAVLPLVTDRAPAWKLDIYIAMTMAHMFLALGWWMVVMRAIQVSARHLLAEIILLSEYNEGGDEKTGILVGRLALDMRLLWLDLCKLVRLSGKAIAPGQGLYMLNSFIMGLYSLYKLLSPQDLGVTIFFSFTSSGFLALYLMCVAAHNVTTKVYLALIEVIYLSKNLKTSKTVQKEMVHFFVHLSQRSPEVSLNGYVTVGRGLVRTIATAVLTNLLILYQLKIKEHRLEFQEIFTLGEL